MKLLSLSLLTALAMNAHAADLNMPQDTELRDALNQASGILKDRHQPVAIIFADKENADGVSPAVIVEEEDTQKETSKDSKLMDRVTVAALFGADATTEMNKRYNVGQPTIKGQDDITPRISIRLVKNLSATLGYNAVGVSGNRLRLGGQYLIHDGRTHVNNPRETNFDNATERMDVYVYGEGSSHKTAPSELNFNYGAGIGLIKHLSDKVGAVAEIGVDSYGKSAANNRNLGLRATGGFVVALKPKQ